MGGWKRESSGLYVYEKEGEKAHRDTGNAGWHLKFAIPRFGFFFFFFLPQAPVEMVPGALLLCLCLHPQLGSRPGQLIPPRLQAAQDCKNWQGKEEQRPTG